MGLEAKKTTIFLRLERIEKQITRHQITSYNEQMGDSYRLGDKKLIKSQYLIYNSRMGFDV